MSYAVEALSSETFEISTRASFLKSAGLAAISASALGRVLTSAQAATASPKATAKIEAAYLPTWLNDNQYQDIQHRLKLKDINRMIISFAQADANGKVEMSDSMKPSLVYLIGNLATGTEVFLAIGGQKANPNGWKAALKNPEGFTQSVSDLLQELSHESSAKFSGVDLDFEYPKADQAHSLVGLVKEMRHRLPIKKISMAIPPTSHNLEGFNLKQLTPYVDNFNVMTYDYAGSWSKKADDLAPGPMVIQNISDAVQRVGDEKKIIAGFPAYAYEFVGAKDRDSHFKNVNQHNYNALPQQVTDDSKSLTSETTIGGNWVSCVSPKIIHSIIQELYRAHPDLGGSFYWSLDGATQAHLDAVQ